MTFQSTWIVAKKECFLLVPSWVPTNQVRLQKTPILPRKAAVEDVEDVKPAKAVLRESGCTADGMSQDQGMSVLRRHLQSLQNVFGR